MKIGMDIHKGGVSSEKEGCIEAVHLGLPIFLFTTSSRRGSIP